MGDNLAVIRYCVGTARLRKIDMQAQLKIGFGKVSDAGWVLEWQAVRRRLNKQSDELATRGVFWAAERRDQGLASIAHTIDYLAFPLHLHCLTNHMPPLKMHAASAAWLCTQIKTTSTS